MEPKYLGDPINAVRIFNEKEVDELIVLDIDATVNKEPPNFSLIAKLAAECRMPLCYGGGVVSVEQASRIIDMGVELGIVNKSGSWYSYNGDKLGQGRDGVKQLIADNPGMANEIELKIREKLKEMQAT